MVIPRHLSSPQYISCLSHKYAATNNHAVSQDPKPREEKLAELQDLISGRLAWPWTCKMRGSELPRQGKTSVIIPPPFILFIISNDPSWILGLNVNVRAAHAHAFLITYL